MATVTKAMREGFMVNVNGEEIRCHSIDNDVYGKPRYVVHFLSLGVESKDYGRVPGLTKYRAKWFGGGYVFTAFALEKDLKFLIAAVNKYYKR